MATSVQETPEALARIPELIAGDRNARGIPSAVFVVRLAIFPCWFHCEVSIWLTKDSVSQESVDTFMAAAGIRTIEPLVGSLQQLYRYA